VLRCKGQYFELVCILGVVTDNTNYSSIGAADFLRCYNTTKAQVLAARKMARSGQKEQAVSWLRFIQKQGVIPLMLQVDWSTLKGFPVDVSNLRWHLEQLEIECHPLSEPPLIGDLNKIEHLLELIAMGQQQVLTQLAQGGAK
jgi:hypothetical protein